MSVAENPLIVASGSRFGLTMQPPLSQSPTLPFHEVDTDVRPGTRRSSGQPGTVEDRVVQEFLTAYTGNTRSAYRRDLTDWFGYCDRCGLAPMSARRMDIQSYLQDARVRGLSDATIARRLAALRGLYNYAAQEGYLSESPAQRVRLRRTDRSQVVVHDALDPRELNAFLDAADAESARTASLTWLMATTGIRVSEACNARIEDIHEDAEHVYIDVTCKGLVRRSIPLQPDTWQRVRRQVGQRIEGPIHATRTGKPIDRRAAARDLKRIAKVAGIGDAFTPHWLRHTFVSLARGIGCALEDVQQAAGHADPATTRRYDQTVLRWDRHPGHAILDAIRDQQPSSVNVGLDRWSSTPRATADARLLGQTTPRPFNRPREGQVPRSVGYPHRGRVKTVSGSARCVGESR